VRPQGRQVNNSAAMIAAPFLQSCGTRGTRGVRRMRRARVAIVQEYRKAVSDNGIIDRGGE